MLSSILAPYPSLSKTGNVSRTNQGHVLWYKFFSTCLFLVTAVAFILADGQLPMLAIFGLALTGLLVLTLQVGFNFYYVRLLPSMYP
jgi:hypothetical protein